MALILQLQLSDEQLSMIADSVARKLRAGKDDSYSVAEVAAMMKVNPTTIRRRVEAQVYPKVPNLSPVRIPAAFIDRLLDPNPDSH
jgi:hypothetical protein